jgi:hypothetical protein
MVQFAVFKFDSVAMNSNTCAAMHCNAHSCNLQAALTAIISCDMFVFDFMQIFEAMQQRTNHFSTYFLPTERTYRHVMAANANVQRYR